MDFWSQPEKVGGNVLNVQSPWGPHQPDSFDIFDTQILRSVYDTCDVRNLKFRRKVRYVFSKDSEVAGVSTRRYVPEASTDMSTEDFPANSRFFQEKAGVYNMSTLVMRKSDRPTSLYVTKPHHVPDSENSQKCQ